MGLDPLHLGQLEASLAWVRREKEAKEQKMTALNGSATNGAPSLSGSGAPFVLTNNNPVEQAKTSPDTNHHTATEPSPFARLCQKVLAVYEDVDYVQKDRRNSFHGYTYASEAAIKAALHAAFRKHGLILQPPEILEVVDTEPVNKEGKEGKGSFLTTIKVKFTITDPETGASLPGTTYGRGSDNSDKGIYKALTGALKYWLTTAFLIATGDDPEEQQPEAPPEPRTRQQRAPRPVPAAERQAAASIDTGGNPIGTQAAADHVAAQKIAAGTASAPAETKSLTRGKVKEMFAAARMIIGDRVYLEYLAKFNLNAELRFVDSKQAMQVYAGLVPLLTGEVA